ncbi:MAG TPA: PIN domain-containing protein [Thermoanaerobaculia bacterium]|nr:PIN domain-containing protein [Thermoanaerobaculia bacterium]
MAIVLDTGVLYAYYDRRDSWHTASRQLIEDEVGGLIVPAPVIPEVDYLLGERLGPDAQILFYQGLTEGSFFVADLPQESYPRVLELNEKYRTLRLGFVDAAVMAVAEHLGLGRIGTTDRRHFGAVQGAIPFDLLPA